MKKRRTSKGKGRRTAVWLGLAVLLAAAGFVLMRPATDSVYRQMYPRKYSHYIEQYSREYGVTKTWCMRSPALRATLTRRRCPLRMRAG